MALKIDVYARNLEVTDRINEYVQKKVSKLDRFISDAEDTRVDLAYVKAARSAADRQVAQITIRGKGFILRTEESADDIFAAIDAAVDKMQRQIERLKGKRNRGRGDGTPASEVVKETSAVEEEFVPVIARRKKFDLIPMDELEAIEQMKLLQHDNFFVFFNAATDSINVLYRRVDGSYGLIEPQLR
ncbi:ribosomal subunit interface protein [Longilinea arvoryzae]|uniref:Ribosome hibernation promoting factor n=1 Tax=Longilinea arvoryzae TaxID=360412 RepID=A0A0S7BIR2_9CHLR|nr:ribosome-associated translation inhibitor RaiA [Longilinea arvoryzae]GAP14996.1 ribosomal subunit interface protein [Longilinea arvoryzae]